MLSCTNSHHLILATCTKKLRLFAFHLHIKYTWRIAFLSGLSITLLGKVLILKMQLLLFLLFILVFLHLNNFDGLSIQICHPKICYFKLRGIARPWTPFWHNKHSLFKDQFERSHYSHHNCVSAKKTKFTKQKCWFFFKTIKSSTLKNSKANILHAFYLHAWSFSHLTLNLRKLLIESSANDWHWIISQNNDPFFLASVLVKKFLSRPSFSSPLYTPRGIFFFDNSVYSPNCIT